jgi:hypothetical protein
MGTYTSSERVCLTATSGLIAFRSGNEVVGRELYNAAISRADKMHDQARSAIAKYYLAAEEVRARTKSASSSISAAQHAIPSLSPSERTIFEDKLAKLKVVAHKPAP